MPFARYIGYRLATALPVIFGIIMLNFMLIHLAPGDAASVLAGESGAATSEYMDELRHKFGLDQSLTMIWARLNQPITGPASLHF